MALSIDTGDIVLHNKTKKTYVVCGKARHTETDEELILYSEYWPPRTCWARPKENFLAEVDGKPRFTVLDADITKPRPIGISLAMDN